MLTQDSSRVHASVTSSSLWPYGLCSPPGFSVHGISQARILEWVAVSFSRGSSQPRDQTHVSCISRRVLYHWWHMASLFNSLTSNSLALLKGQLLFLLQDPDPLNHSTPRRMTEHSQPFRIRWFIEKFLEMALSLPQETELQQVPSRWEDPHLLHPQVFGGRKHQTAKAINTLLHKRFSFTTT